MAEAGTSLDSSIADPMDPSLKDGPDSPPSTLCLDSNLSFSDINWGEEDEANLNFLTALESKGSNLMVSPSVFTNMPAEGASVEVRSYN